MAPFESNLNVSEVLFLLGMSKPRMRELIVSHEGVTRDRRPDEERGPVLIYDLAGELFSALHRNGIAFSTTFFAETERSGTSTVVLRLKRTSNPDVVVVEHLEEFLRVASARGVTVLLAGVRPDLLQILDNVGVKRWFDESRIFPEEAKTFSA